MVVLRSSPTALPLPRRMDAVSCSSFRCKWCIPDGAGDNAINTEAEQLYQSSCNGLGVASMRGHPGRRTVHVPHAIPASQQGRGEFSPSSARCAVCTKQSARMLCESTQIPGLSASRGRRCHPLSAERPGSTRVAQDIPPQRTRQRPWRTRAARRVASMSRMVSPVKRGEA